MHSQGFTFMSTNDVVIEIVTKVAQDMGKLQGEISNIKENVTNINQSVSQLQTQSVEHGLQLDHQNSLLDEHIKGVEQNAERITVETKRLDTYKKEVSTRLDTLEVAPKMRSELGRFIIQTAAVTSAASLLIAAVIKAINYIHAIGL